jgi:hypothetical protein
MAMIHSFLDVIKDFSILDIIRYIDYSFGAFSPFGNFLFHIALAVFVAVLRDLGLSDST